MSDNKSIESISPTIGVREQKHLIQMTRTVNVLLTKEEFTEIIAIYGKAINRILKENGEV